MWLRNPHRAESRLTSCSLRMLWVSFCLLGLANCDAEEIRAWSDDSGDFVFEGTFKSISGDIAIFATRQGQTLRVPLGKLGQSQRRYVLDIDEQRKAGLNPPVLATIAPAVTNAPASEPSSSTARAKPAMNGSAKPVAGSVDAIDSTPSREWKPKDGKAFLGRVLRQEYSKQDKSQCFVFSLSDGETKSLAVGQLTPDQRDLAIQDLRVIRKAKEARVTAVLADAGDSGPDGNNPPQARPQSSDDRTNSALAGAFGSMSQAIPGTSQLSSSRQASTAGSSTSRQSPENPRLSYDGNYPKSSFRVRLEECTGRTDVPSLQLYRTLSLKLAESGLSLNEMDWAEHHFRNKLPTTGFTAEQQAKYTRFLKLTADGF